MSFLKRRTLWFLGENVLNWYKEAICRGLNTVHILGGVAQLGVSNSFWTQGWCMERRIYTFWSCYGFCVQKGKL